jgi:two-component system response regulator FixJ
MNGREVTERLQQDHSDLAILYMTGHSRDILEGVGLDPEELLIIRKPFNEERLLGMIRAALDRAGEAEETQETEGTEPAETAAKADESTEDLEGTPETVVESLR